MELGYNPYYIEEFEEVPVYYGPFYDNGRPKSCLRRNFPYRYEEEEEEDDDYEEPEFENEGRRSLPKKLQNNLGERIMNSQRFIPPLNPPVHRFYNLPTSYYNQYPNQPIGVPVRYRYSIKHYNPPYEIMTCEECQD